MDTLYCNQVTLHLGCSRKLNTISVNTRQNTKSKYGDRKRFERASQKQSSNTYTTSYERVKLCRERKKYIKSSERVNVGEFTQNKRPVCGWISLWLFHFLIVIVLRRLACTEKNASCDRQCSSSVRNNRWHHNVRNNRWHHNVRNNRWHHNVRNNRWHHNVRNNRWHHNVRNNRWHHNVRINRWHHNVRINRWHHNVRINRWHHNVRINRWHHNVRNNRWHHNVRISVANPTTGDPRDNPLTSGIVRHDPHLRKEGSEICEYQNAAWVCRVLTLSSWDSLAWCRTRKNLIPWNSLSQDAGIMAGPVRARGAMEFLCSSFPPPPPIREQDAVVLATVEQESYSCDKRSTARRKQQQRHDNRYDGNTALLARRSDEALGVRVSVARIAPSLLDLGLTRLIGGVAFASAPSYFKVTAVNKYQNSTRDGKLHKNIAVKLLSIGKKLLVHGFSVSQTSAAYCSYNSYLPSTPGRQALIGLTHEFDSA
ncbi:hypothetical protein PR048_025668 [Dryococelus australis]|uniref:Uncharacterized protein n=1 Tax=Dryococelus australis TaxID=614101 RepID=A0ABQ9GJ77_9NEOP|nr:hypothetical protein PR048_025668 [Dryococelus australis]